VLHAQAEHVAPAADQPPSVSLTAPADGASFTAPAPRSADNACRPTTGVSATPFSRPE
jgi:hypothetical protein